MQCAGEHVAVFGKKARNVLLDEALDCVFGWTIGHDALWRAENADTFKSMARGSSQTPRWTAYAPGTLDNSLKSITTF